MGECVPGCVYVRVCARMCVLCVCVCACVCVHLFDDSCTGLVRLTQLTIDEPEQLVCVVELGEHGFRRHRYLCVCVVFSAILGPETVHFLLNS